MENKFIILTNTLCQGDIPAWFDDTDKPVLFNTEKDAVEEMLSEHIVLLETRLRELKEGIIAPDDVDLNCEDRVVPCCLSPDGVITTDEHDVLYDPKTYQR